MAETEPAPAPEQRRITRLIRFKEVQHRVGLGRSTIYRWMSEGKFPKPVQLGGYAVAWTPLCFLGLGRVPRGGVGAVDPRQDQVQVRRPELAG